MPSDYVPIKTFIKCDPLLVQLLYDETKMRTRQKQSVATDTWRSLGCIVLVFWGIATLTGISGGMQKIVGIFWGVKTQGRKWALL